MANVKVVRMVVLEEDAAAVRQAIEKLLASGCPSICLEARPFGAWVRSEMSRTRTRLAARVLDGGSITVAAGAARQLCRALGGQTVLIGTSSHLSVAAHGPRGWRPRAFLPARCVPQSSTSYRLAA